MAARNYLPVSADTPKEKQLQAIDNTPYAELFFKGKVKTFIHEKRKAFVVNAAQCPACGLCVIACPEKAINLRKNEALYDETS